MFKFRGFGTWMRQGPTFLNSREKFLSPPLVVVMEVTAVHERETVLDLSFSQHIHMTRNKHLDR